MMKTTSDNAKWDADTVHSVGKEHSMKASAALLLMHHSDSQSSLSENATSLHNPRLDFKLL
jgi:hypothetical protein